VACSTLQLSCGARAGQAATEGIVHVCPIAPPKRECPGGPMINQCRYTEGGDGAGGRCLPPHCRVVEWRAPRVSSKDATAVITIAREWDLLGSQDCATSALRERP
jgi:hypothetical protein